MAMEAVLVATFTRTLSALAAPLFRVKLLRWPSKSALSFNVIPTMMACLAWGLDRATRVRIQSFDIGRLNVEPYTS